jgi:flagellar motor switch protein FliG
LEIARLETIDKYKVKGISNEFYQLILAYRFIKEGGIDHAKELLQKTFNKIESDGIINLVTKVMQSERKDD